MRAAGWVALAVAAWLAGGCAGGRPTHHQRKPLPPGPICRVAVLPFVSEADYPVAHGVAHKVFQAELNALGTYLIAQEGDVLRTYQQLRIFPGQEPSPEELGVLGSRLGAQILVTGKVLEMRENPGERSGVTPVVALRVHLHDGPTGEPLWTTYHRRQGTDYRSAMHFGKIHTVTGLTQQMAQEIIELWLGQGLTRCDVSPRL